MEAHTQLYKFQPAIWKKVRAEIVLRPNGKVIKYICYNTKVSTFMANFKTLHIGYSVTGFEEKILMFDEVK